MSSRDVKRIAVWAIVTMVVIVGILGSRMAISQNDPAKPEPTKTVYKIFSIYTAVEPGKKPYTVDIKLKVTNESAKTETFKDTVCLIRQEFTGNPWDRSLDVSSDFKNTVEYSKGIELKLKSGETAEEKLTCEISARPPKEGEQAGRTPTYAVMLGDKAKIEAPKPSVLAVSSNGASDTKVTVSAGGKAVVQPPVPTLVSFSPRIAWPKAK